MTLEHVHQLVNQYGYWLMAFGALIEGETFLVAGGIAVQQGWLNFPGVIALAVLGSMFHDHVFFFTGRYASGWVFRKKPSLKVKASGVLKTFDKYGVWLIIAFRFAYGIRTIVPTVIGMSPISTKKFTFFDFIGGLLWAFTFVIAGMLLGEAVNRVLSHIGAYEHVIFRVLAIVIAIAVVVGVIWWRLRRKRRQSD